MYVLFPGQTARNQKKSRLLQHQFCVFLVVQKEVSSGMRMALLASGTIVRMVTSRYGHSHVSHLWWVGR